MKYLLLANPTSGGGKGARAKSVVAGYLASKEIEVEDISGTSYESARVNLRSAIERYSSGVLIVIGGDGMVHLAIQDIAKSSFAMLLIPAGTGNDFARSAGIALDDPIAALEPALGASPTTLDLGQVDGRYFAEILSTGFDSLVNERANRIRWESKRKYDLAMLLELPVFKPLQYQMDLDGRQLETEAMLIAVANGESYGGGMRVCPNASMFDGFFDLMILEPVSKIEFLKVFPKVFKGTHISHPKVRMERARSVTISAPAVAYADGERIGSLPISARIVPNALNTWSYR